MVKLGGRIGWKSIEIMSGRIGRIGWKSIEITLYASLVKLVKLGGNPLRLSLVKSTRHMRQMIPDSTRHHLNGFPPNLTDLTRHNLNELGGQIGQIGWKSIEIMPGRIG